MTFESSCRLLRRLGFGFITRLLTRKKYSCRSQLGPLAVRPFTKRRQLCIEPCGFHPVSGKLGRSCRAVKSVESIW